MGEIFESSLTAEHWSDSEGNEPADRRAERRGRRAPRPRSAQGRRSRGGVRGLHGQRGHDPRRWYRHAAIFLWPERRHFEVLCDRDSRDVVPVLKQMVTRGGNPRPSEAAALKAQCIELATAILAKWREEPYGPAHSEEREPGDLLEALAALDDPGLIGGFLGDVMIKDVDRRSRQVARGGLPDARLGDLPSRNSWPS